MTRTVRSLVAIVALVSALGLGGANASAEDERLAPRVSVATPWAKNDTVGDASRPQGDVKRVVVANGRRLITFTFRTVANPIWDTSATSFSTRMVFKVDWRGTTVPFNRRVVVSQLDGGWSVVIFNGAGNAVCLRQGGVQVLPDHGFRFRVPVGMCMGGAHVIRVASEFLDDHAADATDQITTDRVPNSGGYGPFIRLP